MPTAASASLTFAEPMAWVVTSARPWIERVDAFVDGGHGHDFDIIPSQAGVRERAEHVVPDRKLGRIFPGGALAFDIGQWF